MCGFYQATRMRSIPKQFPFKIVVLFWTIPLSQYSYFFFIFEFFGSLGTKTLLLWKFCFWYGNTIMFYILSFDVRFQENSKNDNFEVQQVFIQTLRYQKYPQIACQRGCKVALIAFVWLFSTVHFQMSSQIAWIRGCKVALIAFVWLFSNVHFQMRPQINCFKRCIVT